MASGSTVPDGLFGLHTNTMSGCSRSTTPTAWSASMRKSSRRGAVTTSVPVMRAM